MNIEKLNPWNWFKHKEDSNNQIPLSQNEVFSEAHTDGTTLVPPQQSSLLQLHQKMGLLFDDIWPSLRTPSPSYLSRASSLLISNLLSDRLLFANRSKRDVSVSENEHKISVELPGLSENDTQIEFSANTLIVKGQMKQDKESKGQQYYCVERSMGGFQRTLSLPEDVDQDAISATMKNGLLVIKLPRKTTARNSIKRVSISS
ncbi:Hsp20/alpha crystallin family protein [Vibrio europaeus]|uniref:Hsp20/alpha crystallin family protein n=1 Tax=Vibrio europaeus TaxID=300876 RepID=UPI00233F675B|nr:Hsp20/alpha crystallin family protein [Vibrio europaeus]MDC5853886.1 Hsp20/alpha crystallin family protein [Vibrio europaeus]